MLDFNFETYVNIFSAIATLLMVVATWKMANVTRKTLEEQNKPHVIVYPEQKEDSPTVICFIIQNIGTSPAYDVNFKLSENLYTHAWGIERGCKKYKKFTYGPFVEGISYLPPKGKRVLYWGQLGGILDSLGGKPAQVVVQYNNAAKVKQKSTISILDVKDFEGVTANETLVTQSVKHLKEISKNIEATKWAIDRKLHSQNSGISYMWAYIAWKALEEYGFPKEMLVPFDVETGLTREQIADAESAAHRLLREYRPDLCPKED